MAPLAPEEIQKAVLKARIGRRVKLSPEARKAHRHKMMLKAARAWRMRQVAKGLTQGGKTRKRPVREWVSVKALGSVADGGQWVCISTPRAPLTERMRVLLIYRPMVGCRKGKS